MTDATTDARPPSDPANLLEAPVWKPRRWWGLIVGVFALQLGLIYWLSDRTPMRVRSTQPLPTLRVAGTSSAWTNWLALADPTVFALPNAHNFSELAWLRSTPADLRDLGWTTEPQWQPTLLSGPEVIFSAQREPSPLDNARIANGVWPELSINVPVGPGLLAEPSFGRVEGELTARKLLTPFHLPSFGSASGDLLTNTIVQILVNRQGFAESLTLLVSSGSAEADQQALQLARDARFEPLPGPANASERPTDLTWGQLIFCWQTLSPVAVTNSSPAKATL
jgi:TonB family protein